MPMPEQSATKGHKEKIFRAVEQEAKIKGAKQSLYDDTNYPRKAKLASTEGTVQSSVCG